MIDKFYPRIEYAWTKCLQRINRSRSLSDIRLWMDYNLLKLNGEKTEVMLVGTSQMLSHCSDITNSSIHLDGVDIQPVDHVRNLGCLMDKLLKGRRHISKVCSSVYLLLRDISKIRHKLNFDTCKLLINGLITSRIDYCNGMLCGAPKIYLSRLQKMQNMACRVILKLGKYDHISHGLKYLHWIKVTERIEFKLCCYAHQCYYSKAPPYLQELIQNSKPSNSRSLRSSGRMMMAVSYSKLSTVQSGSFVHLVPRLWNGLPYKLKNTKDYIAFKKCLKTYLFCKSHAL